MPADRPVPLDEYPIHQAPLSMKHLVSGDRNAYDRCIFHVFDHAGRAVLILGLGVYPNAGVIDAYATLRIGDELLAVRASDALGDDRMNLSVGPLRITVDEPLKRIGLHCDADPDDPEGLSYDITWTAEFPAVWEPHHVQRRGTASCWKAAVSSRPATSPAPSASRARNSPSRRARGPAPATAVGECARSPARTAAGRRRNTAPRASTGSGYPSASRTGSSWSSSRRTPTATAPSTRPSRSSRGRRPQRRPTRLAAHRHPLPPRQPPPRERRRPPHRPHPQTPRTRRPRPQLLPLAVGAGYPPAADWQHGTWQGRAWTDRRAYDLSDPAAHPMAAYGVTDHSARFTLDGRVGHGIFEHGSFGRHDPSGFTDHTSVAP